MVDPRFHEVRHPQLHSLDPDPGPVLGIEEDGQREIGGRIVEREDSCVSGQTAPSGRYPAQVGSYRVVGEEFLPSPRRELLDPTCRMVSHALQHVDQIRVGIHSL